MLPVNEFHADEDRQAYRQTETGPADRQSNIRMNNQTNTKNRPTHADKNTYERRPQEPIKTYKRTHAQTL